ncbi:MAG: molybdopterin-binding protein [Candidatus Hodarchaeota archaeon]
MLQVLLISIGNELLKGKTINTNATFLGEKLTNMGFKVLKIITIPDEGTIVSSEISQALATSDFRLIIITGGLGPTWDDSTSLFLANALNIGTELNPEALNIVKRRYNELFEANLVDSPEINPSRRKMAIMPIGAKPFDNPIGTAPGICFDHKLSNTLIYCLPGVPREMKEMFYIIEPKLIALINKDDVGYYELAITTSFTDESLLAPYIEKVQQKFDVWIKSLPETYQEKKNIKLLITKSSDSQNNAKRTVLTAKDYFEELIKSS